MAGHLIVISAALLLLAGSAAAAPVLQDPTRPAVGDQAAFADSAGEPASGRGELQSILIQPGRKPRALIGGQWVEQGRLWGDLRVVKINPASVILRPASAGSTAAPQELKLTPGIEKMPPAKQPAKHAVERN